ncbi:MAG: glucokinase [Candidatus Binatia bacterium]|nr:glucokinase [Candidatus Binatia bacterium]
MILAVDIGGTKTRVAIFQPGNLRLSIALQQFLTAEIASLPKLLSDYIVKVGGQLPSRLAVAVAGPVVAGRSVTVNLPWSVDAQELAAELGIGCVRVLNDLEAAAYAVPLLSEGDCYTLQPGLGAAQGNRAVIAAGTGLGEAGLYWDGANYRPFATEGGHTSFAPCGELEDALLLWLRKRFGHVSWERVLSGPGLVNLYEFLSFYRGEGSSSHDVAEQGNAALSPEEIVQRARQGEKLCAEAMRLFSRLYGAEAGNLALKLMAIGGVYVVGSIAVTNLDLLERGGFIEAFLNKGRMRPLLEAIPVRVVLIEELVLLGAARYASLLENVRQP